jgi:chorismate mutase
MNKKKLKVIRKKIDLVDKQLLNIIGKRTTLVKKVIAVKNHKKQIVDKIRIKKVLINIKNQSIKKKIDVKVTNKIWRAMIGSYIDFERRKFKKK